MECYFKRHTCAQNAMRAALRAELAEPRAKTQLEWVLHAESERRAECARCLDEAVSAAQQALTQAGAAFLERLVHANERLLLDADGLLCVDDVEVASALPTTRHIRIRIPSHFPIVQIVRTVLVHVLLHRTVCAEVEPKKLHTSELVRRKQAGVPHALLTADEPRRLVPTRGRRLWPGVPSNQLPANETQAAAATSTPLPLVDGGIERRERDHTTPASGRGGGAGSSVGSRSSSVLARGPERNASPGQAAAGGKKKAEKKERASPAPPQPSNLTPSVASQKTTLAHLMTVDSRDSAFRVPIPPCRIEPYISTPLV